MNDGDVASGRELVKFTASGNLPLPADVASKCLRVLTTLQDDRSEEVKDVQGQAIHGLVKSCKTFKVAFRDDISEDGSMVKQYGAMLKLGSDGLNALVTVSIDDEAWKSSIDLPRKQKDSTGDLFKLLLRDAQDTRVQAKALQPLIRLLAGASELLKDKVGQEESYRLLSVLSAQDSNEVKTSGLLTLVKYMDMLGPEQSQTILGDFMSDKLASNTDRDLIRAFSTASLLFPVMTTLAASLFLTEGFLTTLLPLLHARSGKVELAALDMMSAACVDKACREALAKHCQSYLSDIVKRGGEGQATAAVVLAKILGGAAEQSANNEGGKGGAASADGRKEMEALANMFGDLIVTKKDDESTQASIEGLAYASLNPTVKDKIAKNEAILKSILAVLQNKSPAAVYGALTILCNITEYARTLSEEQKKMEQLKNYANAQPNKNATETHPLDEPPKVTARCKLLLDAGVVPILVAIGKTTSPSIILSLCRILNSLSKTTAHRGIMAQQGGVKLLLQYYSAVAAVKEDSRTDIQKDILQIAPHALARVLISINPTHVFGASSLPLASAVAPLLGLAEAIQSSTADYRDLLPQFESLLALTNLASTTDAVRDLIMRLGWPLVEDLLLATNDMIQRAAVELVCNLMLSPTCVSKFCDGSKQATHRMHILTALASSDDVATKRAAGGALAMLTEWDAAVIAVLEKERGVKTILELASSDNSELMHRGVICILNIATGGGQKGIDKIKAEGGIAVLQAVVQATKSQDILVPAVEALKKLS